MARSTLAKRLVSRGTLGELGVSKGSLSLLPWDDDPTDVLRPRPLVADAMHCSSCTMSGGIPITVLMRVHAWRVRARDGRDGAVREVRVCVGVDGATLGTRCIRQ